MALKYEYLLASMDGLSHAPFRSVCFEYGADGASTEMLPALSYAYFKKLHKPASRARLLRRAEEGRLAAQLLGAAPEVMAAAARRMEALGRFDAIEINMGCPARTVVNSGSGSVILRDVKLADEMLRAVCGAVELPVRLKMRLGWAQDSITAPEIAACAQEAGCSAIILHGRTREQMYTGEVQIEEMRRVRAAVRIPLYANGAVESAQDAAAFAEAVGADGVCIGRAALKAPWIFDDIRCLERGEALPERDAGERIGILLRLAARICEQKREDYAMCEMRRFCNWYLPGLTAADAVCAQVNAVDTLEGFNALLEGYLNRLEQACDTHIHPELLPAPSLDTVKWQKNPASL